MASLNLVQLIGNLGADPESRSMQNGKKVVSFKMAVSESWKDRDGNRQERTEWVLVVIFNEGLGGVAERYLRKGSKVYVSGKFQTRKWQDRDGQDRYTTEVVLQAFNGELILLDGRKPDDERGNGGTSRRQEPQRGGFGDLDDDPPFITNEGAF